MSSHLGSIWFARSQVNHLTAMHLGKWPLGSPFTKSPLNLSVSTLELIYSASFTILIIIGRLSHAVDVEPL
ncbi:hypothetical protein M758_UG131900 [Ceratodon purpureus]|nr:hypothetical protein M758_UG131900 [Ceratodon purpureus]